jgi:adenine-specific DNA-methyltransferase
MKTVLLEPHKALNNAFLKIKPDHTQIMSFNSSQIEVFNYYNHTHSTTLSKNLLINFLSVAYFNSKSINNLHPNGKE